MKATVFYHLYYPDSINEINYFFSNLDPNNFSFYFNIPYNENEMHKALAKEIKKLFPSAVVMHSSNKGKDIGGKLTMLNFYLQQPGKSDYLIFLHDKRSEIGYTINNQQIDATQWKKELYSILDPNNLLTILQLFDKRETGMVASKNHIYNLRDHGTDVVYGNNYSKILAMSEKFELNNINFKQTPFVGGTMFWVRSKIYESFFSKHSPLEIRATLEDGSFTDRYTGTNAHAMERIFSWIVTNMNYTIEGI